MKKNKPIQTDEQIKQHIADLDNKWKRALADYQNLEKRIASQQQMFIRLANIGLLEKLLPIFDDLKRASNHLKDAGLSMITTQLDNALEGENVKKMKAIGELFDPTRMECVDLVDGSKDEVISVVQDGYVIGELVIRPAKVLVGKGNNTKENV